MNKNKFWEENINTIENIYNNWIIEFYYDEMHNEEDIIKAIEQRYKIEEFTNELQEKMN